MADPKTIAIAPTEAYREALLGTDPELESYPPRLLEVASPGDWRPAGEVFVEYGLDVVTMRQALPLVWRGKPVPDGIARAVRTLINAESRRWTEDRVLPARLADASLSEMLDTHRYMARNAMGDMCFYFEALARAMQDAGIAAEVVIEEGGDV